MQVFIKSDLTLAYKKQVTASIKDAVTCFVLLVSNLVLEN